jgi:RHS repeat-associated protein
LCSLLIVVVETNIGENRSFKIDCANKVVGAVDSLNLKAETALSVRMDKDGQFKYYFVLRDHLGNTRVTFSDLNNDDEINEKEEIIQINNYYTFGLNMEGNWNGASGANKFQFNGKEWNDDFGLGWNHYGARFYDPAAARWWTKDPLSEHYSNLSSYAYVANNPIRFIDPTGMAIEEKADRTVYTGEDAQVAFMAIKAKMNSKSGVGSLDLLTATITQFSGKFADARAWTKENKREAGYQIYYNADKNDLQISDMIQGEGTAISGNEQWDMIDRMSEKGINLDKGYKIIGRYHAHPLTDETLKEDNPISHGDIHGSFFIANQGSFNGNSDLTGFFDIVDSGTKRYIGVITDPATAKASYPGPMPVWEKTYNATLESKKAASPTLSYRDHIYQTLIELVSGKGISITTTGF